MNSKLLIKQNNELFDKLQIANLTCRRLTEENKVLKEKIAFLTEQLAGIETSAEKDEGLPKIEIGEVEETQVTKTPIEVPPEIEYGSKIIGEIVMSATAYSNSLTTSEKENIKELLNLILGRTEVAKAEILNIISSEVSLVNKMEMIDSQRDEAIEYFKSVMEQ